MPYFEGLADGSTPPTELEASAFMRSLDDTGRSADDFIFRWEDLKAVWQRLNSPSDWEVVWAADAAADVVAPGNTDLLGYEPTWFTGDHFSALSDCMCFPMWHGTNEAGELFAEHHAQLNEHALFPTQRDAESFLRYYRSFEWTETGEYVIAEVRLPRESP